MKRINAVKFLVIILLTGVLTYLAIYGFKINGNTFIQGVKDIRTGIDIRGGVRTILSAPENVKPKEDEINTVIRIIEKRLDAKNIYDRTVVAEKSGRGIIVEIPWKKDEKDFNPQKTVDELGKTALLTFREVDETKLDENGKLLPVGKIVVKGREIVDAQPDPDLQTGQMQVKLTFSKEGGKKFEEATGRLVGKRIAIFMDEQLISAPRVNSKISASQGAVITLGDVSKDQSATEAKELAETIRAGSLPFKLESREVTSITAILGQNALNISVQAGIVALILVWIFMFLYYRLPGIIANIALLAHTAIQLLAIAAMGITITLPGIAGIILTIGMGVDANVIIFERIKEELRKDKPLRTAIDIGFKKGFAAILDANMTTLISAAILYIFGTGPIQSFALTLGIGVALSFLTAVTFSRIMLKSVSNINLAKHPWLYGIQRRETV